MKKIKPEKKRLHVSLNNHASEQEGKNAFQPAKISTLARKIRLNSWQSDNNNILCR